MNPILTTNSPDDPAPGLGDRPLPASIFPAPTDPAPDVAAVPDIPGLSLTLTDFVDLRTLQDVQDSFTALTRLSTAIRDASGQQITSKTDSTRAESLQALDWLVADALSGDGGSNGLSAPIIVAGHQLGSITVDRRCHSAASPSQEQRFRQLARHIGVPDERLDELVEAAAESFGPNRAAGVQLLYLMANSIARLCYQGHQLRRRFDELSTLYEMSTILSGQRDLQQVLDAAARSAVEAMGVKAAMIRLLDDSGVELVPRSVYNLSQAYLDKGPILVEKSVMFREALTGEVVYIENMTTDPRVLYPEDAEREGLVSVLCSGISYQGRPIGVMQLYTATRREFSSEEINLLRAIAQLAAAAINTAKLDARRQETERLERQLRMAADVQKRMLPHDLPSVPGLEIAARYVPSFELSGDFYDFIDFQPNLGVAIADVAGKGVAASLLMAAVRSSLRAYAQDVYDIDEIVARVNAALCRDTLANEFATLFYGVIDSRNKRFTYCNAGHEPPLLLRNGKFIPLEAGGMVVGVDPAQKYDRGIIDLLPGDLLLIYTDGLPDALNFAQQKFGRQRILNAMREVARQNAHQAANHILWEMRRFVGLNRLTDDTTLVVIKVNG